MIEAGLVWSGLVWARLPIVRSLSPALPSAAHGGDDDAALKHVPI